MPKWWTVEQQAILNSFLSSLLSAPSEDDAASPPLFYAIIKNVNLNFPETDYVFSCDFRIHIKGALKTREKPNSAITIVNIQITKNIICKTSSSKKGTRGLFALWFHWWLQAENKTNFYRTFARYPKQIELIVRNEVVGEIYPSFYSTEPPWLGGAPHELRELHLKHFH